MANGLDEGDTFCVITRTHDLQPIHLVHMFILRFTFKQDKLVTVHTTNILNHLLEQLVPLGMDSLKLHLKSFIFLFSRKVRSGTKHETEITQIKLD